MCVCVFSKAPSLQDGRGHESLLLAGLGESSHTHIKGMVQMGEGCNDHKKRQDLDEKVVPYEAVV